MPKTARFSDDGGDTNASYEALLVCENWLLRGYKDSTLRALAHGPTIMQKYAWSEIEWRAAIDS